ncbi:MAG: hypothetical protein JNK78_14955 [Planctomycetes bacterium]|nr:hypothetical protein [Planctomycetota bacterium]
MLRLVVLLLGLLVLGPLRAQERQAKVTTNTGRVVAGKVVAMDLDGLQIQVGEQLVTIAASDIRTCQFDDASSASAVESAPRSDAAASTAPSAVPPVVPIQTDRPIRVRLPLPDAEVEGQDRASTPFPTRQTRLRARIAIVDEAYPWLVPTEPMQWLSVALLMFACLSLVVHLSVSVVGAENNAAGRAMAMAVWYLVTAFLQVALVPSAQLATFVMLVLNPALALFWLRNLFAMTRGGAMVAFAVQLGFLLLGYGVLELITSLLGSIGVGHV